MGYLDRIVNLTTIIKNNDKGETSDLIDDKIIKYLIDKMNTAAQIGHNSITLDLRDLTVHLAKDKHTFIKSDTDYSVVYSQLEHAVDQISDESQKYQLELKHFNSWYYEVSWPDNAEF